MTSNFSNMLNLSRWLAACLVVFSHLRHLILVDYKDVSNKTTFAKFIYFSSGFGHEAVIIFFVISGFLVGGLTLSRWRTKGFGLRDYSSARLSRIYTVLVPALILGLMLDVIGLTYFNDAQLYTHPAQYHTISLANSIGESISISVFVGNLFMLQNILVHTLGSNGPLWSLANEWWYYCLFALFGASTFGKGYLKYIGYIGQIALIILLPLNLTLWGLIWLLGLVAHAWVASKKYRPHPLWGGVIFIAALYISRISHNVDNLDNPASLLASFIRDLGVGLSFVIFLAAASRSQINAPFVKFNDWCAKFSYSTYLFYFPVMLFAVSAGYQLLNLKFRVQPDLTSLLYIFGLMALVYLICFLFSLMFEQYTQKVRMALNSLLNIHRIKPHLDI